MMGQLQRRRDQRHLTFVFARHMRMDPGSPAAANGRPHITGKQSGWLAVPWSLIEQLPIPLLGVSDQGHVVSANLAANALLGHPLGGLVGQPIDACVPRLGAALRSRRKELSATDFQAINQHPDEFTVAGSAGARVTVAIDAARCPSGKHRNAMLSVVRLTTREERAPGMLQRFFELSLDLFCIANLEGFFIKVNPNFSRKLGYSDADLRNQPFLSFVHPDDQTQTISAMSQLAHGKVVSAFCNRYRDSQGEYHWFEWTARCMPGEDLIFAVARDITDRVHVEQQLHAAESSQRTILDNTPAVIYVKDRDGRYQFVNREFSHLFHVSLEEARSKTDFDIFPADLAIAFRENDRYVIETEAPLQVEEVVLHDDGPHTYLSLKCPVPSADGASMAVAGISTDITDRVRLHRTVEELRLAQEVQRRLFPHGEIHVEGFDVFGKVVPASQLCGDYFDYVVRPDGKVAFCVADVSGHGVGPALAMVETRAILRMLLKQPPPLNEVVGTLNQLLCEDMPETSFVTMLLVELDIVNFSFRYIGAGHDALLLRQHGMVERLPSTACVLGMFAEAQFPISTDIPLDREDLLLICTDGVQEAMSPERELFDRQRIVATVKRVRRESAATILRELFATARAFSRATFPLDDMTAILVKRL